MATKTVACGHIGIVWGRVLLSWDQYAQGTYTGWSYDLGSTSGLWHIHVTATISGGGDDQWYFVDQSARSAYKAPLQYPLACPGWTAVLDGTYPDTLPDGSDAVAAYDAGPATARKGMYNQWCGTGADSTGHSTGGTEFGITPNWWRASYSHGTVVVADQHGIQVGTLTADEWDGVPTNMRGDASVAISGGGGSGAPIDLTPIVDALNDIALIDVDYTANNGATIFSMRGRTRT